jgi:DNA repair exonuclease SbcCD nuclease subunit
MAIKVLAAADLHLGKRTSGLDVLGTNCATRLTWQRMVDFAITETVDVLLLAGDVVDRDNRYYEASGSLQEGFGRLEEKGIEVFLVTGNHDYDVLPQILRNHPYENVHLLGANGRWDVQRVERHGDILQVIGWSFPQQYVQVDPLSGMAGLPTDPNYFRLGMIHCDVDQPYSRYAPVALANLENAEIDAWVLGHIHKPTVYHGDKFIRYPGSPQALSAKEQGGHGGIVFTVAGKRVEDIQEVLFSNCRFERLDVDVSGVDTLETFRGQMETALSTHANDRLSEMEGMVFLVYDLRLTGQNSKGAEIEKWFSQVKDNNDLVLSTGTRVLIRELSTSIRPVVENLERLATERSPAGVLAETLLALRSGQSTPFLEQLTKDWEAQMIAVTNSAGFQPLQEGFRRSGNPRTAKEFIEEECNRLLSELLFPAN